MTRPFVRHLAMFGLTVLLAAATVAVAQSREDVTFASGDVTLAGTLTLPAGPARHPAVVLISGSGPQDRDSAIAGIEGYAPFAEISDVLAAGGVAVLRYDDRGAGASGGDNLTATTEVLAEDVEAALRYLMRRREIDPLQLGLIGHSEGAMIAPMVAARNPAVAFFVAVAPPVAEPIAGLVTQEERIMRSSGASEAEVREAAALARRTLELNAAGDWKTLEALLQETVEAQLMAMPAERRAQFGDVEQATEAIMATTMAQQTTWMHWFVTHDPRPYWRDVRVPALAVFGGKDVQVDEEQHRGTLQAAVAELPATARDGVTIVTLPDANHLFLRAGSGGVLEYGELDPHLMAAFLDVLQTWVLSHVSLPNGA